MIELRDVQKTYARFPGIGNEPVHALAGVTLTIGVGESVGLVGLNGAGKSTLVRLLMGYARPSTGDVRIGGLPPRRYAERFGIAYVPERVTIPGRWTVEEALRTFAMLDALGDRAWERLATARERLGLGSLAHRKVSALSKGNLQRLAIAQAILGDRPLMVLDEPTDGLDPLWIAELREILLEWRSADPSRTVVLASHNLPEVERLAERIVILHNGSVRGDFTCSSMSRPLDEEFLARIRKMEEARP